MPLKDTQARREYLKRYYKANGPRVRRVARNCAYKRQFGITLQRYEEILAAQGGMCGICLNPPKPDRRLDVDHCHATKRVRGLLCHQCNVGIGHLRDSPELLHRATEYILSTRDWRVQ
jgi:hypothetical protein